MKTDGTDSSGRRKACVTLVYRRTLVESVTSIEDLIEGGLARLLASNIAVEINLDREPDGKAPNQPTSVEIGKPRRPEHHGGDRDD